MDKNTLIKTIQGLLLITEENREQLIMLVQQLENPRELKRIEQALQEEPQMIEETIAELLQNEAETGEKEVFEMLDESLKEERKVQQKVAHFEEEEQQEEDNSSAERLLNDME